MFPLVLLSWVQASYKKLEGYQLFFIPNTQQLHHPNLLALYMLIVRYIRILLFGLLAAFVPLAGAKKDKSKSKVGKVGKVVKNGSKCIDQQT